MVKGSMRRALALALVLAAAPAVAGEALVISGRSAIDGLDPGMTFASDAAVHLAPGERIQVMLQSGAIVALEGPHDGPLPVTAGGAAAAGALDTIGSLLVGRTGTTSVLGASRLAAADVMDADAIWSIPTDASGPRCTSGALQLEREDASKAAEVVAWTNRARVGPLRWPAGDKALALPEELGAAGLLVISIGFDTRRYELQPMPPTIDAGDDGVLLAWLASEGCIRQAEVLLDRIRSD